MKHIKKFNEELLPSTYRRAATKFRQYDKSQSTAKAHRLEDWANQQEFGLYNMHFVCGTSKVVTGSFTEPKLIGIYYGNVPGGKVGDDVYGQFISSNNMVTKTTDEKAEILVDGWIQGRDELSITFEFGFKPTNETIVASKNHAWLANTKKNTRYLYEVPSFSIELLLSDWNEGIEEYDSEYKWEAERNGDEYTPTPIPDLYEGTNYNEYFIQPPLCNYYSAIFSDRKSAQKFLQFFQNTMQTEKVKDVIMDVLRVIGSDTKCLENVLNSYKKVRIHGLFDENPPSGKEFHTLWFNKKID
jgi:hypothetical protein